MVVSCMANHASAACNLARHGMHFKHDACMGVALSPDVRMSSGSAPWALVSSWYPGLFIVAFRRISLTFFAFRPSMDALCFCSARCAMASSNRMFASSGALLPSFTDTCR